MYASKTMCMTLSGCILISAPRIRHQDKELRAHDPTKPCGGLEVKLEEKELYTECQQQAVLWTPGAQSHLGPLGDSIELPLQSGTVLGQGPCVFIHAIPHLGFLGDRPQDDFRAGGCPGGGPRKP